MTEHLLGTRGLGRAPGDFGDRSASSNGNKEVNPGRATDANECGTDLEVNLSANPVATNYHRRETRQGLIQYSV